MNGRILVTGAAGFVGSRLVRQLGDGDEAEVVALVRREGAEPVGADDVVVGDLESDDVLERAAREATHVVHLAGRAHGTDLHDEALHRRVHLETTQRLFEVTQLVTLKLIPSFTTPNPFSTVTLAADMASPISIVR